MKGVFFMSCREDIWMLKMIFQLSDHALIHMVNHLFQTEYESREDVSRKYDDLNICLTIGCANRYEFQIRHFDGCLQICAEDRGCIFYESGLAINSVVQVREPRIIYFGKNTREESCTILEFPGNERIILPILTITLEDYSAQKLQEAGLIIFLPFLCYQFLEKKKTKKERQESLKYFMIRDIVETLNLSFQRGDLTIFDVEKLKQLCKQMAWRLFAHEDWMNNFEMQDLFVERLDADIALLERIYQMEIQKLQNRIQKK